MGLLGTTCSFTRLRLIEPVPDDFWPQLPEKLKQYAFMDIDDIAEERSWGWTNIDDMLDTKWQVSPPEKGEYIAFSLRLDTRRIPPAVMKKHLALAMKGEQERLKEQGKKFIQRERRKELREQVRLRLLQRFLPIPAVFDVVWNTSSGILYLASMQSKVIELFMNHFTLSFNLHLDPLTPYGMASSVLDENAMTKIDFLEETTFV